jgi:hypothetical protein
MPRRKSERNHVFLSVALRIPQAFHSLAKSTEESDVVMHTICLTTHEQKDHEQISCLLFILG